MIAEYYVQGIRVRVWDLVCSGGGGSGGTGDGGSGSGDCDPLTESCDGSGGGGNGSGGDGYPAYCDSQIMPTPECEGAGDPVPGGGMSEEDARAANLVKIGKVVKGVVDAGRRGENLTDAATWRRIGRDEWIELADCAATVGSAVMGSADLFALGDCALSATIGFRGDDFRSLLKRTDEIPVVGRFLPNAYDELIGAIARNRTWGQRFTETADIRTFTDIARLNDTRTSSSRYANWKVPNARALYVWDNIVDSSRGSITTNLPDVKVFTLSNGSRVTWYNRTSTGNPGLDFFGRFGDWPESRNKVAFDF